MRQNLYFPGWETPPDEKNTEGSNQVGQEVLSWQLEGEEYVECDEQYNGSNDFIRLFIHQSKTSMTEWMQIGYTLNIEGLSVDDIWKHMVKPIGNFHVAQGRTLDKQIEHEAEIQAILPKIEKLETRKRNTRTPRMKHELHHQIQALTSQMEALKRN